MPQLRQIVARFSPPWAGFDTMSGHVGFVVDKVALGQVFFKYFICPANSHTTDCSTIIIIYHPGLVQ
jgi:hypothetical protein